LTKRKSCGIITVALGIGSKPIAGFFDFSDQSNRSLKSRGCRKIVVQVFGGTSFVFEFFYSKSGLVPSAWAIKLRNQEGEFQ